MLSQEGNLAQYSLLSGIEALGKLNYDKAGTFYPAFFQLSIGLERLMKIVVILEHKSKNSLGNPPGKQIRDLSHDLVKAYELCKKIALDRGRNMEKWHDNDTLEYDVLCHLSEFAQGARYFNLDSFSEKERFPDPIVKWASVHQKIADKYINGRRQVKINERAIQHCDKWGMFGFERSITGEYRTQVDCTFIHELFKQSNKYCVWTFFRLIAPFYSLLIQICRDIRDIEASKGIDSYTVPDMNEFFPFMLCNKETATRRQRWVGIY